jgi:hypothetical protein
MSETMVERVEKAVRSAFTDAELNNPRISFEQLTSILTRAAIEAMRQPTEAMIAEGESAASFGIGKPTDDEAVTRVWQCMIDAALATPSPERMT